MTEVVLDANAVVTFLEQRSGADAVQHLMERSLRGRIRLLMSIVNWGEAYYALWRVHGRETAIAKMNALDELSIELCSPDKDATALAAALKAEYGLPYADCFAAALAIGRKAAVATADYDFRRVEKSVNILWIASA